MKKSTLLIVLLTTVALILGACGKDSTEEIDKNSLQAIQDKGELTVGIMGTYDPYNFLNEEKE